MNKRPGLLWFDDSTATLVEKIRCGAKRHLDKTGSSATDVYIHTSYTDFPTSVDGITIQQRPNILQHHFLYTVEDK